MDNVCSFVDEVRLIPNKLQHLSDVIADILKQMVECAIFIREYTGRGFAGWCQSVHLDVLVLTKFYSQTCETDILEHWPGHQKSVQPFDCTQTVI
jgi:hypothetical protein